VPDQSQKIDRGLRADKLLRHDLLIEAREQLRLALLNQIEQSPVRDSEGREYLYLMLKASNDLWGYLEQMVRDGKVEVHLKTEQDKVREARERVYASVKNFR
jgi:hypothetical protein